MSKKNPGNRMDNPRILVLGACGLAGRAIVDALVRRQVGHVIASGRNKSKLEAHYPAANDRGIETLLFDATDAVKLGQACASVDLTINAIGPFNRDGASIARTVIEAGCHYIDCANEQIHYERLFELAEAAQAANLLLTTGAGLLPGLSSLLAADVIQSINKPERLDIAYVQLRHAYEGAGKAGIMGGVLDAVYRPYAVCNGQRVPVTLGKSRSQVTLSDPFGSRKLLEVPTIDVAIFAQLPSLREIHSWFHLGDQPLWLFGLIRWLDPVHRPWAYRLIERLVERIEHAEFARAQQEGLDPDAILLVQASKRDRVRTATAHFTNGADPTAVLPARIAADLLGGKLTQYGLRIATDLYRWTDIVDDIGDSLVRFEPDATTAF